MIRPQGWRAHIALFSTIFAGFGCGQANSDSAQASSAALGGEISASATSPLSSPEIMWRLKAEGFPSERSGHALAHRLEARVSLLFGGLGAGAQHLNDTWEWNGISWLKLTPTNSPAARFGHALAYYQREGDASGRVLLFGGVTLASVNDSWEWDGSDWSKLAPSVSPSARSGHALAYDSERKRVVLFGGLGTAALGDTWEWDGTEWSQKIVDNSPPDRFGHGLAYDSERERVVLFGGNAGGGVYLGDTWEYDGSSWIELSPAESPSPRDGHSLTYDAARGKIILFGGSQADSVYLDDMWEWDGSNWSNLVLTRGPAARDRHAIAYDAFRAKLLLFGGRGEDALFGDSWEYGDSFGDPCDVAEACESGFCVDGVCCDTACTGQCEACDLAGKAGVCSPVTGDPRGSREGCEGEGACKARCDGENVGSCVYPDSDTLCGEAECYGGSMKSGAPSCDGEGSCVSSQLVNCERFACKDAECLTSCESDEDCRWDSLCLHSGCYPRIYDDGGGIPDGPPDASPDADAADVGSDAPSEPALPDADLSADSEDEIADPSEDGCGCRVVSRQSATGHTAWFGLGFALAMWRRGRSRRAQRS